MARRRKSGEGTVRLRKDGRWEGRIVVGYDDRGLPKTKSVLAKMKTECVERLEALKEEIGATEVTHVTTDMQRQASGIVGNFITDMFGEELKPWQSEENQAKEQ